MADILIKGLELQDDWELLSINIDRNGKVTQSLDLKCKQIAEAVIVPPHGRLVDWDEVEKCVEETADSDIKQYALFLVKWAAEKRVFAEASEGSEYDATQGKN